MTWALVYQNRQYGLLSINLKSDSLPLVEFAEVMTFTTCVYEFFKELVCFPDVDRVLVSLIDVTRRVLSLPVIVFLVVLPTSVHEPSFFVANLRDRLVNKAGTRPGEPGLQGLPYGCLPTNAAWCYGG